MMAKNTQQKIQQAQDAYVQLRERLPQLEQSLVEWKAAAKLLKQLSEFYFNPNWIQLHDNEDNYVIDTKGHYSVLSEDTIWNIFIEQRELAEELAEILKLILTEENES